MGTSYSKREGDGCEFEASHIQEADRAFEDKAPAAGGPGKTHLLVVRLDYTSTHKWNPAWPAIDTKWAGEEMLRLAHICEFDVVECLTDNECTKEAVAEKIEEMGAEMDDGDFFIIYYTGHGAQVAAPNDDSDDEGDDKAQVWCLVDSEGRCSDETWMRDYEIADVLQRSLPE
eukprot:TRINITY_DN54890_c0_g1_i1.p1 TRINITY_DN54890_c0_g1~~TRINITY_DN54890_c0_g1_i1.p1  ORF type:complete len:173 (+),score=31.78 TRINITY_DN54890_c0_g1_i1:47-565(+)